MGFSSLGNLPALWQAGLVAILQGAKFSRYQRKVFYLTPISGNGNCFFGKPGRNLKSEGQGQSTFRL
jgi:hypothetical protein